MVVWALNSFLTTLVSPFPNFSNPLFDSMFPYLYPPSQWVPLCYIPDRKGPTAYCWHNLLGTYTKRRLMLDRHILPRHYLLFSAQLEIHNLGAQLGLIRLGPMLGWIGLVLGSGPWAQAGLVFTIHTVVKCNFSFFLIKK